MLRHKDAMQTEPWVHLDETGMAMLASLSQVLSFEPGERVVAQGAHTHTHTQASSAQALGPGWRGCWKQ